MVLVFAEHAEESVYIIMWFLVMVLWSMVDDKSVEHKLCLSLFQAAEDDVAPCSHIAKLYCKKQNPFQCRFIQNTNHVRKTNNNKNILEWFCKYEVKCNQVVQDFLWSTGNLWAIEHSHRASSSHEWFVVKEDNGLCHPGWKMQIQWRIYLWSKEQEVCPSLQETGAFTIQL